MTSLQLYAAGVGIIVFLVVVIIMSAVWRELATAVRACASISNFGVVLITMSAVWRELAAAVHRMRVLFPVPGYLNDKHCMA